MAKHIIILFVTAIFSFLAVSNYKSKAEEEKVIVIGDDEIVEISFEYRPAIKFYSRVY